MKKMLGWAYGTHVRMMRMRSERGLVTALGAVGIGLAGMFIGLVLSAAGIKLPK